jgi:hypothetical protein
MAHPYHHALSSVKKWGGCIEDYLYIHSWFDESKGLLAGAQHRALRHHAKGIFDAEALFGETITVSSGKVIPTRWVGEQHVKEDMGYIPSFEEWLKAIAKAGLDEHGNMREVPWMFTRAVPLSRILGGDTLPEVPTKFK